MTQWTLEPVLPWLGIVAIAVAMLGVLWVGARGQDLPEPRRRLLLGLRSVTMILILVGLVRPGCVQLVRKPQRVAFPLLLDVSRSLQLPHQGGGVSRWEKLQQTLDDCQGVLERLGDRFDVRWFGFDGRLVPLESQGGRPLLPAEPDGGQTDYGEALHALTRNLRGERLAGVVVVGDGVQNADFPTTELPRAVREFAALQAPLFAVPLGQAGDGDAMADVAVTNLPDQFAVFVKNELTVQGTVSVRGFVNQEIPVQLIRIDGSGQEEVLQTQTVMARQPREEIPVTLSYTPDQAGEYRLVLRAEPQAREVVTRNNELPAFLTVYEGGLRVLYLEGELNLEQRYLRRSLAASQDLEVDFLWIDQRNRDRWPIDLIARFRDESYDVFVLGDLDSRALHQPGVFEENLQALAQRVSQGAGLIMLGGTHSFGPGRYHSTPLAELLPIQMQPYEAQDFDAPINHALHLERELTLKPAETHYLTRLDAAATVTSWAELPPLLGANRFVGLKPRAQVLLETERDEPILVVGNVGGRVVAFAGDSTWRWWTFAHADVHRRFWRQVVLWAAGLDGLNRSNVVVDLPQRRLTRGSPLTMTVAARRSSGEALPQAVFAGTLETPSGERVPLVIPGQGDERLVRVAGEALATPGLYHIRVTATEGSQDVGATETQFIVFDDDREKAQAAADPDRLARMAEATAEVGGRLVAPEGLRNQLEQVLEMPVDLEVEIPQRWLLGDTLADGSLFLVTFVLVLGIEWWLRKRWGLV